MSSIKAAGIGGGVALLSMGDIILALIISGVVLIIFALLYRSFYNKVENKMMKNAESLMKDIKKRAGNMKLPKPPGVEYIREGQTKPE